MSEHLEIHESLIRRSKSARRSAWFSVSLIVTTVFLMLFLFYAGAIGGLYSYELIPSSYAKIEKSLAELESANKVDERISVEVLADLEKMKLELKLKESELDLQKTQLEQSSAAARRLTSTITDSVTKVGAVLISLYLVQILLSLTRYHFKLADHMAITAEVIKYADGDVDKLQPIMDVIGINHIDFGKSPTTPTENIIDLIKELPSKIATNKPIKRD